MNAEDLCSATHDARYRVAAETGVPADLIAGDDEDAMRAFAEAVLAYCDSAPPRRPRLRPDLTQGATGRAVKHTAHEIALAAIERRHGRRAAI